MMKNDFLTPVDLFFSSYFPFFRFFKSKRVCWPNHKAKYRKKNIYCPYIAYCVCVLKRLYSHNILFIEQTHSVIWPLPRTEEN